MRGNPFKYTDPSGEYANEWQMQLNDRMANAEQYDIQYQWMGTVFAEFEFEQGLAQQFAEGEANDMREHLAGVAQFHAAWAQSLKISGLMQSLSLRQVLLFGNTSASSSTEKEDDKKPGINTGGDKTAWDLDGNGTPDKNEADLHWLNGNGTQMDVDNNGIDWTGLEVPEGKSVGDKFAIETTDAFIDLPWETASVYGGTTFKIIYKSDTMWGLQVMDQPYHYKYRANDSKENIRRNILNFMGMPYMGLVPGTKYKIHYLNPYFSIPK